MHLYDNLKNPKIHEKIIKELNVNIFGGHKCTTDVFMSNISEHIKEVLMIYKKMMSLVINLFNPQNIAYISTLSSPDSFGIIFGFLVRIQTSIALLLAWYYTSVKGESDDKKALEGYKDFFFMVHLLDLT